MQELFRQIFSSDICIMKRSMRVFDRRSAIFRQMPFVHERQTSRASERERTKRSLFICSRTAANRQRVPVGWSQSMIAICNVRARIPADYIRSHTRAEIFIAARAAATDARKVLQIRGGGLLLRPLSAPR